jgi:hypothetical protein
MKAIFLLLLLTGSTRLWAQPDTLAPIRKFVHVCSGYRQLPVELEMDIRSSSNLVLSAADTTHLNIRAVLCQKGTYMAMDGMEQLANDSLLLVVNPRTKRMLLYPNHRSVAERVQSLDRQFQDSSVTQLVGKYVVKREKALQDTALIDLESRALLQYTSVPAGLLQVSYEPVTERPYAITVVERRLIPVNDSVYKSFSARPEWAGKTITIKDSSFFLVREETRLIRFRKIDHQPATEPPVRISDRIAADLTGVYRPVKDFAAFRLIQQAQ